MIKKIFIILLCSFFLTNCGFKTVNNSDALKFDIVIETITGDNKINYLLRNELRQNNLNNKNKIKLNLETIILKEINEKNIKNEITKYELLIKTRVKYNSLGFDKEEEFLVTKSGVYNVGEQFSRTINNEKKLIKFLTQEISTEIINNLMIKINDL